MQRYVTFLINNNKTHVGKSNTNSSYNLTGLQIETTDTERDLGVLISNNLKTIKQCINMEK